MEINKAQWTVGEDTVQMTLPIQKVDRERRTISGFATLDNVDGHGDVVLAEASQKAFAGWRGNVREMHQPIAVGKAVNFEEKDYYDPKTEKVYRGVYVTARISKGAQDTWEKILDETYTGFSIGGKILKKSESFDKDSGELVRFIEEYSLDELSVVDVPANDGSRILSIQKNADGTVEGEGIAMTLKGENVLYCKDDDVMFFADEEARDCMECGDPMTNIGWVESDADKTEVAKDLLQTYKDSHTDEATDAEVKTTLREGEFVISREQLQEFAQHVLAEYRASQNEGGTNVAEQEAVTPVAEDAAAAEATTEETVEKAADVDEVTPQPAVDTDALVKELGTKVTDAVTEALTKSTAAVEEVKTSFDARVDELTQKISDLSTKVDGLSEVPGRVEALENATAVKKSDDLGGSEEKIEKSIWSGRFLGVSDLTT